MSGVEVVAPAETAERANKVPSIYVASLPDYNAGRLHGVWLDATEGSEALHQGIQEMLAASPEPAAEEWAIHDQSGFGPQMLDEFESIETVSLLATGIRVHGEPFAAWASTLDQLSELATKHFDEYYRGTWPSTEAYAEDLLDSTGATEVLEAVPDWLQPYVQLNVAAFARDLELSGDLITVAGSDGVHVFEGRA
jgi:antirestriction protein